MTREVIEQLEKTYKECVDLGQTCGKDSVFWKRAEAIKVAIKVLEQEPKTGHWIEVIDEINSFGNKTWHHKCSICGNENSGWGEYKYCPNCGCRMVEPQESEE